MSDAPTRSRPAARDRRVQRSRAALVGAFNRMFLERGYDAVGAAEVAGAARVGRSTFYEHYAGIDDLLAQSMRGLLDTLARASLEAAPDPRLAAVLEHFWDNRKVARGLLGGRGLAVVQRLHMECFEAALLARFGGGRRPGAPYPARLVATQLAAGQLALIESWLTGRTCGAPADIAEALRRTAHAAAMAG